MEQIEGRICVEAALQAQLRRFHLLILRAGLHPQNIQLILSEAQLQNIPVKYVPRDEIEAMAYGKSHGGIIALALPKPLLTSDELLARVKTITQPPALLLLEGIDDSQNLGFTLRSAEAMGIDAILLKKHLWNFDSTMVSRASSGAYERMAIALIDQAEKILPELQNLGLQLFGCIANAKRTIFDVDLTQPAILAIGGEKRGLSAAVRSCCNSFIRIPSITAIGSLALSHAASVVMAEMMRQRLDSVSRNR